MLTPVVLGDTMLFSRAGNFDTDCEGTDAGTYWRLELRTGQERVWLIHETFCGTYDTFEAASPVRRTVYFREKKSLLAADRLYEYDVDRDMIRELPIDGVSDVPDISADGRMLLVLTRGGIVLYDVIANSSTPLQGLGEIDDAGLLAQP